MEKLRMWDARTQASSSRNRGLRQAFSQLSLLKDKLGLSDAIVEKTAYIYRKAQGKTTDTRKDYFRYISCDIYCVQRIRDTQDSKRDSNGFK